MLVVFISLYAFAGSNPAVGWQNLERKIRDGKILKTEAAAAINEINNKLKQYLSVSGFESSPFDGWVFPVKGYDKNATGKRGYAPKGYNFFDGNKHGGHPAYDIFIRDKNFDCLDDKTKRSVEIMSLSSGIVISANTGWKRTSDIRGGNYVYIYDDVSNYIFYYAHLDKIFVKTGQFLKAGDVIAILGRTGKNAYPHRSPTHLHLMVLNANTMKPVDIYYRLMKVKY